MDIKTKFYVAKKTFDIDLVVIHKIRTILALKKLPYIAMCILDLSKVLMCEFHYDYIKSKHGNKSRLLFRDIDNLIYEIEAKNVYDDFSKN